MERIWHYTVGKHMRLILRVGDLVPPLYQRMNALLYGSLDEPYSLDVQSLMTDFLTRYFNDPDHSVMRLRYAVY